MRIAIKRGLNLPLDGQPEGEIRAHLQPQRIALNLAHCDEVHLKPLVREGDRVKIGTALVENKEIAGMYFASCAAGIVRELRKGAKRRLTAVIIDCDAQSVDEELYEEFGPLPVSSSRREQIIAQLLRAGLFAHMRMRPFDLFADPRVVPRDIFVSAIDSRPYAPSAEAQVAHYEHYFQTGLSTLAKLTSGAVHLVYHAKSSCGAFTEAKDVEKHIAQGPHPIGNPSVHIHFIRPIAHSEDIVWTLTTSDVIAVGRMMAEGRYHPHHLISIAGTGILKDKRGFFRITRGFSIKELVESRLVPGLPCALISGDPLTGVQVEQDDFLGFNHVALSVLPKQQEREAMHFLRLGSKKYSAYKAYLSGHLRKLTANYAFTTNQHGEERAFLDGTVYDRVMPMRIATMHLVRALLTEDDELAVRLGLLEIAPEDFALPTFICPSKIEMVEIVRAGLHRFAREM